MLVPELNAVGLSLVRTREQRRGIAVVGCSEIVTICNPLQAHGYQRYRLRLPVTDELDRRLLTVLLSPEYRVIRTHLHTEGQAQIRTASIDSKNQVVQVFLDACHSRGHSQVFPGDPNCIKAGTVTVFVEKSLTSFASTKLEHTYLL